VFDEWRPPWTMCYRGKRESFSNFFPRSFPVLCGLNRYQVSVLSHNIGRNADNLLEVCRFGSIDTFRTWCTDPKNKTRGEYILVRSTAASLGNCSCVALPPASMQSCGRRSCFWDLYTMFNSLQRLVIKCGTALIRFGLLPGHPFLPPGLLLWTCSK